jgi:Rrf2 family transcriptional regulator, cysteine metabolism repressor
MSVSQKCQYALRAIFELSKRQGSGPVPIAVIARAQAIPPRFLELILGQLKQTGYVESRRGAEGGYMLSTSPEELTVGDIIRFVDGPLDPVKCLGGSKGKGCPLEGGCAFVGLWERARDAVTDVYDSTTFARLVKEEPSGENVHVADFCI